jgi:hypothetical protein
MDSPVGRIWTAGQQGAAAEAKRQSAAGEARNEGKIRAAGRAARNAERMVVAEALVDLYDRDLADFAVEEETECDIRMLMDPKIKEAVSALADSFDDEAGGGAGGMGGGHRRGRSRSRGRGQRGGGLGGRLKNIWRGLCTLGSAVWTQGAYDADMQSVQASVRLSAMAANPAQVREFRSNLRGRIVEAVGAVGAGAAMRSLSYGAEGTVYKLVAQALGLMQPLLPTAAAAGAASVTFLQLVGMVGKTVVVGAGGVIASILAFRLVRAVIRRVRGAVGGAAAADPVAAAAGAIQAAATRGAGAGAAAANAVERFISEILAGDPEFFERVEARLSDADRAAAATSLAEVAQAVRAGNRQEAQAIVLRSRAGSVGPRPRISAAGYGQLRAALTNAGAPGFAAAAAGGAGGGAGAGGVGNLEEGELPQGGGMRSKRRGRKTRGKRRSGRKQTRRVGRKRRAGRR